MIGGEGKRLVTTRPITYEYCSLTTVPTAMRKLVLKPLFSISFQKLHFLSNSLLILDESSNFIKRFGNFGFFIFLAIGQNEVDFPTPLHQRQVPFLWTCRV